MTEAQRSAVADAVARAEANAPFLRGLLARHSDVAAVLSDGAVEAALVLAQKVEASGIAARLRITRNRTMLALAIADLAGLWPLERLVAALSDFADQALDTAIAAAIDSYMPGSAPQGFAVIGLGKHGSRELNYSSDLDPIFIYDPETLPRRSRDEPAEAAVRIARGVVDLLQARDGDGFVFRDDLRLRPASEATPIALPVDAAIAHYESSALAWERAAFIRARAAAGDIALGQRFLSAIQPFVWRRSLDFGAVADLRALTRAIRDHHGIAALGPGFDIKRGRGGIREVEFYAQIHQLIHGGRDATLRTGATLDALAALSAAGRIAREEADVLANAYRLYRNVEHRLQLIDDRQTHTLPVDCVDLDAVARLDGLTGGEALIATLAPHVERVGTMYDALDASDENAPPTRAVSIAGFADPQAAEARIERWRAGSVRAIRSPAAVAAFEAVLPDLLDDLARAPDPDAALARLDQLLGQLSTGINLFRLLDAEPPLRALLIDILSHAPVLAEVLARRPALLDRLVDRTALGPVPDLADLMTEMAGDGGGDAEALFDRVRHIVGEYRFALGVQIVEGAADPIDVAAGYGRVAEAAIAVITRRVIADFEGVHGRVTGGELLILALGRLGGGLLTHASDLDLIYLFTGDFAVESDGSKPLGATHYFNRLAQRVTAALSVPTSVGALYEVDTRLRPSGAQGPLSVSLESFERYQRADAWTWEHMALCRARPVFGSAAAQAALGTIVAEVLNTPRDAAKIIADAVEMRAEMATHKPPKGPLDVKLGAGGLVDLEFAVHVAQLVRRTGQSPDMRLAIAALWPDSCVGAAHDLLTRLLVVLRLVAPDLDVADAATRALVARGCGATDWDDLLARLDAARQGVSAVWAAVQRGEM